MRAAVCGAAVAVLLLPGCGAAKGAGQVVDDAGRAAAAAVVNGDVLADDAVRTSDGLVIPRSQLPLTTAQAQAERVRALVGPHTDDLDEDPARQVVRDACDALSAYETGRAASLSDAVEDALSEASPRGRVQSLAEDLHDARSDGERAWALASWSTCEVA